MLQMSEEVCYRCFHSFVPVHEHPCCSGNISWLNLFGNACGSNEHETLSVNASDVTKPSELLQIRKKKHVNSLSSVAVSLMQNYNSKLSYLYSTKVC